MTQRLSTEDNGLGITVDHGEERTFVRLHGQLSIDSSPVLRERLLAVLQREPPKTIIVDLTELSSIEASGIATLLEALKIARNQHVALCLKGLQGRVVRLFQVTGLQAVFEAGCKEVRGT